MKRVLLTTGGTGGHIFPALAVAEELRRRHPDIELLFMGSLYGPEKRLTARAGIPFVGLPVRGLLGRGLRGALALGRMGLAVPSAVCRVHRFSPDAAAGFGSYAAFAPLLAARLCRVPAVLHEQNAVAGTANRFLAKLTAKVCISLPGTTGFEGRPTIFTGNPVRSEVFAVGHRKRSFTSKHLLVFGGSLGARALNRLLVAIAPQLCASGIAIWHQTGTADEAQVRQSYTDAGLVNCRVSSFIDNMPEAYAWADLVLCRAGASTVSELCAAGLPSILVPYPFAAHDHQTGNAHVMAGAGAALLRAEKELDPASLLEELRELFGDSSRLASMSSAARALAAPEAAASVVDALEEVAATRGRG